MKNQLILPSSRHPLHRRPPQPESLTGSRDWKYAGRDSGNNLASAISARFVPLSLMGVASALLLSSCSVSQEKGAMIGTAVGAAGGAVVGGLAAGDGNRAVGAIIGGFGGAAAGRKIGIDKSDPAIVKVRRGN